MNANWAVSEKPQLTFVNQDFWEAAQCCITKFREFLPIILRLHYHLSIVALICRNVKYENLSLQVPQIHCIVLGV